MAKRLSISTSYQPYHVEIAQRIQKKYCSTFSKAVQIALEKWQKREEAQDTQQPQSKNKEKSTERVLR